MDSLTIQQPVTERAERRPLLLIREATSQDLPEIVNLAEEFFAESGWTKFTEFHRENTIQHFSYVLSRPTVETGHHTMLAVNVDGGEIVGGIKVMVQLSVTADPLGLLDLVYVRPAWRKSHAGRALFLAAENKLRACGCAFFSASPGARMNTDKSMLNMLDKLGFEDAHPCKIKILKET